VIEHDGPTRLVVTCHRREQLVGAITVSRTSRLAPYRDALDSTLHPSG
jgi:hypothetical protein